MSEAARYLLIVTAPLGLIVRDMPGAESEGARKVRSERRGNKIMCARIVSIHGVPYGQVINSSNPTANEWVRIAEADLNTRYVEVVELGDATSGGSAVADAINRLAAAVELHSTGRG